MQNIDINDRKDLARDIHSKGLVSKDVKGLREYRDKQNLANRINMLEARIAQLENLIGIRKSV